MMRVFLSILILSLRLVHSGVLFHSAALYLKNKVDVSPSSLNKTVSKLANSAVYFLQSSGPAFIKLGQMLSTRPDLIGEVFANILAELQDSLPPFASKYVKQTIESELKGKVYKYFKHIDLEALAAASIAQVHKAETVEGDIVAIKILRPNIERVFKKDIKLIRTFAKCLNFIFPNLSRLRLNEVVEGLERITKFELDLRLEAAAADKIRANCKNDEGLKIPKIFWQYSGRRVLVMEWMDAIPVNNRQALVANGHNLHDIAKKLAVAFFNQAYRDGFFHADLHPGNIMVDKNGDVVLLDFGIIGVLKRADRLYIAQILYGFITQDYDLVADLHFKAGYVPNTEDKVQFALACRSIGEPIIGQPVHKISIGKLLKQLFEITSAFKMETQPQLLLLQKTMVTIEGVGLTIYPEVNMWKLAEPWIKEWAKQNFGINSKISELKSNVMEFAEEVINLAKLANKLLLEREYGPKRRIVLQCATYRVFLLGCLVGIIAYYYVNMI